MIKKNQETIYIKNKKHKWNTTVKMFGERFLCASVCDRHVRCDRLHVYRCTVFIQKDTHALIDAHCLHDQALGTHKYVKFGDFCIKHAWIWGQILIPTLCSNFMPAHAQWTTNRMNMVYPNWHNTHLQEAEHTQQDHLQWAPTYQQYLPDLSVSGSSSYTDHLPLTTTFL